MTNAKNIYTCNKTECVSERNLSVVATEAPAPKKSLLKRIADFFLSPDLDLETYRRLEGLSDPREQAAFERWRETGGGF